MLDGKASVFDMRHPSESHTGFWFVSSTHLFVVNVPKGVRSLDRGFGGRLLTWVPILEQGDTLGKTLPIMNRRTVSSRHGQPPDRRFGFEFIARALRIMFPGNSQTSTLPKWMAWPNRWFFMLLGVCWESGSLSQPGPLWPGDVPGGRRKL